MANRRVFVMTSAGIPLDTDLLYLVREGDADPDRKLTIADLGKAINPIVTLSATTTGATPTEMFKADSSRISIPDLTAIAFSALFVAKRMDSGDEVAGYKIEGVIENNDGLTDLAGPVVSFTLAEDSPPWMVQCIADNANDALTFFVTGEAGKTIKWSGIVTMVKVTY